MSNIGFSVIFTNTDNILTTSIVTIDVAEHQQRTYLDTYDRVDDDGTVVNASAPPTLSACLTATGEAKQRE